MLVGPDASMLIDIQTTPLYQFNINWENDNDPRPFPCWSLFEVSRERALLCSVSEVVTGSSLGCGSFDDLSLFSAAIKQVIKTSLCDSKASQALEPARISSQPHALCLWLLSWSHRPLTPPRSALRIFQGNQGGGQFPTLAYSQGSPIRPWREGLSGPLKKRWLSKEEG